jgi:hypothetical protein
VLLHSQLKMSKLLIIPTTARIVWNTIEDKLLERSDQESIFLATFTDPISNEKDKHQIDYSYYNRGKYEEAPKYILSVYSFTDEYEETVNHYENQYEKLDDAIEQINYWLQEFHLKSL